MRFLSIFLFCMLLACNLAHDTTQDKRGSKGDASSLQLELDGMFKINENRFDPVSTAVNNYKVVLQSGKNYLLSSPTSKGHWDFSVVGLAIDGNKLIVPSNARGTYNLKVSQTDPNYKNIDLYVKITLVEKSVFDGKLGIQAGSTSLDEVLQGLSTSLELSSLKLNLNGEDIDSTKFDWEYELVSATNTHARSLNPGSQTVATGTDEGFVISIGLLQPSTLYTLNVVASPRGGDIAGTISTSYIFNTSATLQADAIFPVLFYPPLRSGTTVEPILTGNLGNGATSYSITPADTDVVIDPSTGMLTLSSDCSGSFTVHLRIAAAEGYNEGSTTYQSNVQRGKSSEGISISYHVRKGATLPWILSPAKIGHVGGRNSHFYVNVNNDVASVDDHGVLTVRQNQSFVLTWILEPNEEHHSATASWEYQKEHGDFFSYPLFALNNNYQLEAIEPNWNAPADTVESYSYTPQLHGLNIDSKSGVLSFDSLASFAAAEGRSVTVTYGNKKSMAVLKIQAADKTELKALIALFMSTAAIGSEGNYNAIDTSQVNDMSSLFSDGIAGNGDILEGFNGDIARWDTSEVTSMNKMFEGAVAFNRDISNWNTYKVADMSAMFSGATAFNKNIDNWDTRRVTDMSQMFAGATAFNGAIGSWDTRRVTNMSKMFLGATNFNAVIGNWETEKVRNMNSMFKNARAFNRDISNWDVTRVRESSALFAGAHSFNRRHAGGDETRAENYFRVFTQDRSYFFHYPLFKVTHAEEIFIDPVFSLRPRGLHFSYRPAVNGLSIDEESGRLSFASLAAFAATGGNKRITVSLGDQEVDVLLRISAKDKAELQSLLILFLRDEHIGSTGNYNVIDTTQVRDMSNLFEVDLNGRKNQTIFTHFDGDISGWNTQNVTDMSYMFSIPHYFNQDISNWDTSKVRNMSHMFLSAQNFNQDIGNWDTSRVTSMAYMFQHAVAFNQDIGRWDTSRVTNMRCMFMLATHFNQNIGNWDTRNVEDMTAMFHVATRFNQDISGWNVVKAHQQNTLENIFQSAGAFAAAGNSLLPTEYFDLIRTTDT